MTDWELMFKGVQSVAQSSANLSDGLRQLIAFAATHTEQYDEPDYWNRVASTEFPLDTLVSWAREGLEKLEPFEGWSLALLDCGDAPETFHLFDCHMRPDVDEPRFTQAARGYVLLSAGVFPLDGFENFRDLTYHSVRELNHPILSWNTTTDKNWHGTNGELLWLGLASLALCQPLRDAEFCRHILKGHKTLLLMSGFEEIFFYVGSVTDAGLSFD